MARDLACAHVRNTHGRAAGNHDTAARGRRSHRRRLLQRGGRSAPRDLPADGQGALRRSSAEARSAAAQADSRCVPSVDGRRPAADPPHRGSLIELPASAAWAADAGASISRPRGVQSAKADVSPGWGMAGIETAVEAARRYIIKRPRLTRLLGKAPPRVLMLIGPAGFGKTTLAREWVADRNHVWYQGTTATADVAALAAGLSDVVSQLIPEAGSRMVHRMRATGTPEEEVDVLAELFAEDLADWPDDAWLVFDDYQ